MYSIPFILSIFSIGILPHAFLPNKTRKQLNIEGKTINHRRKKTVNRDAGAGGSLGRFLSFAVVKLTTPLPGFSFTDFYLSMTFFFFFN